VLKKATKDFGEDRKNLKTHDCPILSTKRI